MDYAIKVYALRSTSLTIGAEELSALAKELELAAKKGDMEYVRRNPPALLHVYEKICAQLFERWRFHDGNCGISIRKECVYTEATIISVLLLTLFPIGFFTAGCRSGLCFALFMSALPLPGCRRKNVSFPSA